MSDNIVPGSIVTLKSGGDPMTVLRVVGDEAEVASWETAGGAFGFGGRQLMVRKLPIAALKVTA